VKNSRNGVKGETKSFSVSLPLYPLFICICMGLRYAYYGCFRKRFELTGRRVVLEHLGQ
jgi:hypothetical protein